MYPQYPCCICSREFIREDLTIHSKYATKAAERIRYICKGCNTKRKDKQRVRKSLARIQAARGHKPTPYKEEIPRVVDTRQKRYNTITRTFEYVDASV